MQIRTILYQYIKILIKRVFLLNFTYELLMILEVYRDYFMVGECVRFANTNELKYSALI